MAKNQRGRGGRAPSTLEALRSALRRGDLRILAYHTVPYAERFADHIAFLTGHYRVVSGAEVIDCVRTGRELPERAVWITFDDGDPTVVERGLPALAAHDVHATVFVCPGVLDTTTPLWFQAVDLLREQARAPGVDLPEKAALKQMTDGERRKTMHRLGATGVHRPQLTTAALRRWTAAGNEIGNHTWDHPCLDRCVPDAIAEQIALADDHLRSMDGFIPAFAFPDGRWHQQAERVLTDLGYDVALGFDHRIARTQGSPYQLSRLRIDASASVRRLALTTSGLHSVVFQLRSIVRPVAADVPRMMGGSR